MVVDPVPVTKPPVTSMVANGRVIRCFFDGDVARFNINCFTKSQYDVATYCN